MSKEVAKKLQDDIPRSAVKSKDGKAFVDGFYVVDEANTIFGNLGWSSEVLSCEMVGDPVQFTSKSNKKNWKVIFKCQVRVTCDETKTFHDGVGASEMMNPSLGDAMHFAMSAADTQATKRAMMRFGRRMGLALYDDEKKHVTDDARPQGEGDLDPNQFHYGQYRGHKLEGVSGSVVSEYFKELTEKAKTDNTISPEHYEFTRALLERLRAARDAALAAKSDKENQVTEGLKNAISKEQS